MTILDEPKMQAEPATKIAGFFYDRVYSWSDAQ
jgi:hypothetical protein